MPNFCIIWYGLFRQLFSIPFKYAKRMICPFKWFFHLHLGATCKYKPLKKLMLQKVYLGSRDAFDSEVRRDIRDKSFQLVAEGCLLPQCKSRRHRCSEKERGGIEVLMLPGVVEAWIAVTYFAFIRLFSVVRWQKLLPLKGRNCSGISHYSTELYPRIQDSWGCRVL